KPERLPPQSAEEFRIADGAREEAQVVALQDEIELLLGEVARRGGAMPVLDHGACDVNARPGALPRAIAEIEILDISRRVDLSDAAERGELRGVVERASAAAVQHVAPVFAGQRLIAPKRQPVAAIAQEHRLAGLLAAHARWKANLRAGAEEIGHFIE